jgi:hypothetical protein
MVVSHAGQGTKNDCVGESKRQYTEPNIINPEDGN